MTGTEENSTQKRDRPEDTEESTTERDPKQQKVEQVDSESEKKDGNEASVGEESKAETTQNSSDADGTAPPESADNKEGNGTKEGQEPNDDTKSTESGKEAVAGTKEEAPSKDAPPSAAPMDSQPVQPAASPAVPPPAAAPTASNYSPSQAAPPQQTTTPGHYSAAAAADQIVEERGEVSALYVGRVIGKGGEMIRDLQARSACRIDVDQNVPAGQPRVITYRGTRRTVDFAKRLVHMLCQENASESDLPLGEAKREFLVVPSQSVGKIIGRGGEMIRELQSRSQAKIQVDHSGNSGLDNSEKQVTITGTEQAVTKAREMVLFLVANPMMDAMQAINMLIEDKVHRGGVWGSGPPYPNLPNQGQNMQPNSGGYDQQQYYGGQGAGSGYAAAPAAPYGAAAASYGGAPPAYQQQAAQASYGQYGAGGGVEMEIFYAAKNYMGRIIGQKGVTINDLQRRSACDIQINQDVPPGQECEISIRGSRQGIEMVKQMLREIIEIGPNHPYAGGNRGGGGGGYHQGGYGHQQPHQGYGGYQQDQYATDYGHAGHGGYDQQYSAQGHGRQVGYQAQQAPPSYAQAPQAGQYHQATHQQVYGGGGAPQQVPVAEWKTATSPDGQVYYYNERTGETQWDKPLGMP